MWLAFHSFRVRLHLVATDSVLVSRCNAVDRSGRASSFVSRWLSCGVPVMVHTEFDENIDLCLSVMDLFSDGVTEGNLLLVCWGPDCFDLVR